MKKDKKDKEDNIVCRIIDRKTDVIQGSFSRACHDKYDFNSVYEARLANCHGIFTDKKKYKITKYRIIYELIEDDCDIEEENKEFYKKDLEMYRRYKE